MKYHVALVNSSHDDIHRQLLRLHKSCFPATSKPSFDRGWWWLLYFGTEPIGFAGMTESNQWINCGYLCRAGVIDEHRGRKLQRRLIRVRLAMAKKLNMEAVFTDTRNNPSSANNLIECGFRMYTPRKPWGFSNSVYWRISICKQK